jgi:peptide subunit release factor 1 (eRF1)
MHVNNSEVDLTLSEIQERPSGDNINEDDRTLEDDIAISEAVNAAEEELSSTKNKESNNILQSFFLFGVTAAVAAIFLNQNGAFAFLK